MVTKRPGTDLSTTAIVVVNYGSHALLELNLVAVTAAAPEAAVVVVDNFTSAKEQALVADLCAHRGWLPVLVPSNLGFGEGVNAGVDAALAAGAETLIVLNPDATIARDSLERLVSAVTADPMLMVAPQIRWSDGRVWFSGSDLYLSDGRMGHPRRRDEREGEPYSEWLTGACFAISKSLWLLVGGFDHDYFLYWEDVDLSVRVSAAGGRLLVDREAEAVHDEGGTHPGKLSGRAKSDIYYYYSIRNRLVFAAKHASDHDLARWLRVTPRVSYEVLLQGGRAQFARPWVPLRPFFRGIRDGRRFVREHRRATEIAQ
jgi:N-acetylglucosaminyl-diphospho-decaprenol L-rhamnosyltransferase